MHIEMMTAAVRTEYCTPNALQIRTLPVPAPAEDEVQVKVMATTVNRTDCGVLTGKPWLIRCFTGLFSPRHSVTGTDFSGVVMAKGKAVSTFDVGDKVYGFFDQGLCSHAEYVCVATKKAILKKPESISHQQAAASLEGAHYAFYFLDKVKLEAGDKVLINGGTGAIGNAAVQFLKYRGITVTATCETNYISALKAMGADSVVDYSKEDFTRLNEQFNFVFDAVGKSTFGKCRRLLKPNGIYVSSELGPYWQNPLLSIIAPLMPGKKVKFPLPFSIHRSMKYINELTEKGKFRPLIDKHYRLVQIGQAYDYVMSGQKKGNVIISFE